MLTSILTIIYGSKSYLIWGIFMSRVVIYDRRALRLTIVVGTVNHLWPTHCHTLSLSLYPTLIHCTSPAVTFTHLTSANLFPFLLWLSSQLKRLWERELSEWKNSDRLLKRHRGKEQLLGRGRFAKAERKRRREREKQEKQIQIMSL